MDQQSKAIHKCRRERGVSLLETMMAIVILMIAVAGVMTLFALAAGQNAGQGEVATSATEYAQDKMEQLLALSFTDGATDTTVYPPAATGGLGLGGSMAASTTVGSTTTATTGFVDYLGATGNLLTSSTGAFYTRMWSVSTDSTGHLKTITVVAKAATAAGGGGLAPSTTLVCFKTQYQ